MSLASGIYSLANNWMSVFDKWDTLKHFQKEAVVDDLGFYNKNPIAESHKWDPSYYNRESPQFCPECAWFSWSYSYVITGGDNMTLDRPILDLKNNQFCSHWINSHNGHAQPKKKTRHK